MSTSQSSRNGVRLWNPPVRSNPALLKAEIEWKSPHHRPSGLPTPPASPPSEKLAARITAPTPSTTSVKIAMRFTIQVTLPSCRPPRDSWTITLLRNVVRRPMTMDRNSVDPAMIPNPPAWMSSMITTCPNALQCVPVSSTTSPVTQAADVAVNSASTNGVGSPDCVANGSMRSAVPMAIRTANTDSRVGAGDGGFPIRFGGRTVNSSGCVR